ncbi:MAG: hypothetical protein K1X57_08235 [Gemmataceae bacterium]|nr:hypothetical protein [Gemmataceae bacterium]
MNRVISKTLAATTLASGLAATGCTNLGKCIDPCYPERYIASARSSVTAAFAPQVQNGHILDQTVWNYHFETGKDELTAGGRDHLDGLVRRRPSPDPRVFIATARDLVYDAGNPDKFVELRRDLDEKRAIAVQKYLAAQTAGRPMQFEMVVHDPSDVGQHAYPTNRSILLNHNTTTGSAITGSSASTAGQGQSNSNQGASGGQGAGAGAGSSGGNR